MAVGNASNVTSAKPGVGGGMYAGPTTVTLPTTTSGTIPTGMSSMGYISEDGVKNEGSRETKETVAWGGDVVDTPQTKKTDIFSVTLIESTNVDVLKQIHGASNVTGTLATGISVNVNAKELPEQAYIFDMVLKDNTAKRICIQYGKIIEVSEIEYNDTNPIAYAIKISARPDASGDTHHEYIKAASTTGSGG